MIISTFLGNVGKKYERTRHNLAWMLLEQLNFYSMLNWNNKFKGEWAKNTNPETLILKPLTLMNNSGESVSAALTFFKLTTGNLIVIHDDLELPFGTIQLRKGGGTGGHNGLRSIIKHCGNSDFYRLRLGISRPPAGFDVSSWVLSRFSPEEETLLSDYCKQAAATLEKYLSGKTSPGSGKIELLNL
jgi:PTH1 family peptidyl-tRNA hydrolase